MSGLTITAIVLSRKGSSQKPNVAGEAETQDRKIADAFQAAVASAGELDQKQRDLIAQTRPRPDCPPSGERNVSIKVNSQVELEVIAVLDGCLNFSYELLDLPHLDERMTTLRLEPQVVAASPLVWDVVPDASAPPDKTKEQWNLARLDVPRAGDPPWPSGEGIIVAVIDTGIDGAHPDLNYGDANGKEKKTVAKRYPRTGDPGGDRNAGIHSGHGTFVAGTIAATNDNQIGINGIAPRVQLLDIPAAATQGPSLAKSINWAIEQKSDVVHVALHYVPDRSLFWQLREPARLLTDLFDSAVITLETAKRHGVLVVTPAGNCGDEATFTKQGCPSHNSKGFPASSPNVIAVAATTKDLSDARAPFSTQQDYVDIAAPGEDIWSLEPGGGTVNEAGTSAAAPHVTAAAALLLDQLGDPAANAAPEDRAERARKVEETLLTHTANGPTDAPDDSVGWGRLDINAALRSIRANPPPIAVDGLGIAAFGAPMDRSVAAISSWLGPPDYTGPWSDNYCFGTGARLVVWGELAVLFSNVGVLANNARQRTDEPVLWGYKYGGPIYDMAAGQEVPIARQLDPGLHTATGIGLASTGREIQQGYGVRAEAQSGVPNEFPPPLYIVHFEADVGRGFIEALWMTMDSNGPEAKVVVIQAGGGCGE